MWFVPLSVLMIGASFSSALNGSVTTGSGSYSTSTKPTASAATYLFSATTHHLLHLIDNLLRRQNHHSVVCKSRNPIKPKSFQIISSDNCNDSRESFSSFGIDTLDLRVSVRTSHKVEKEHPW